MRPGGAKESGRGGFAMLALVFLLVLLGGAAGGGVLTAIVGQFLGKK